MCARWLNGISRRLERDAIKANTSSRGGTSTPRDQLHESLNSLQALLTVPKPPGGYRRSALRAQALQEPLARLTQRSERVPSRAFRELEITNIGSKPQPESGTDWDHAHEAIAGR
jgi:hypothetical protein